MTLDPAIYPPLDLPAAELRLRQCPGETRPQVYDPLRGKWVALTPEEWVRQHFVAMLTSPRMGYPPGLMANEVALELNGTRRRADTALLSRRGLRPVMVVEYKAPGVALSRGVFNQIIRYNIVLRAPLLAVSNGLRHYCCHVRGNEVEFLPVFPTYEQVLRYYLSTTSVNTPEGS